MNSLFDTIIKNKTRKKFKKLTCHPKQITSKNIINKESCLDYKTLIKLKNIWNLRYPDSKIINNKKNKLYIWNSLKEKLSYMCDNEMCWIDKSFPKKNIEIKNKMFAPEMPEKWKQNKNEWLSSVDITKIMKQYEESHKNFKFYGPSPIDFDSIEYNNVCVWPEICNFNINNTLKQNINKVGFIFNTDKHNESGSHWIALFLDLKKKKIFFFDSTGNVEPDEIKHLIKRIKKQCKKKNINLQVLNNNNIKHQYHNTECGMYCLYLIITLLLNQHSMEDFKNKKFPDDYMEKYRQIYFNKT